MDEFLSDIYTVVFKQWILGQTSVDYQLHLKEDNDNVIVIETNYSYTEISFHEMNIIELNVVNIVNDQTEFYLHFQMKTIKHAIELFEEMLETIKKLVAKPKTKVLLSCTSGLTTGFFAEQLNEAARLLMLDFEFNAVPYAELFDTGNQYDVILLAPQVSYMHAKVQEILKDKLVLRISSQIFAKYDTGAALTFIQEELANHSNQEMEEIKPLSLKRAIHNNRKILTIAMIRYHKCVHLAYRVYDQNQIILDKEVIKCHASLEDIKDIIHYVLSKYPDIDHIGLAMPGIINNGHLSWSEYGFFDCDIEHYLSKKYDVKVTLSNDVNAAAMGYYASQNDYCSLSVIFQPVAGLPGGMGSIHRGRLIEGRSHVAGELKYLPTGLEKKCQDLTKTPEGALELLVQHILSTIAILGPDVIVLSCQLIYQTDELIEELEKRIPKEYIPEFVMIDDLKQYMLLGQMILCVQSFDENE